MNNTFNENDPTLAKLTVKDLAELIGQDILVTNGLIKFLESQGQVKNIGKVPMTPGQRGKPSTLWAIPSEITMVLWEPKLPEVTPPVAVTAETNETNSEHFEVVVPEAVAPVMKS